VDPEDLKITELYARAQDGIREVVIATNPTTTGEATALHIAAGLRERIPDISVTRLASGLPVGADLEYADELTLGRALAGRRAV
jgi:recombination protein RecR